ncbi:MFS transporter, allantoate permease [Pseudohyphozyma bogoriensis]|nr:MFS transporter, allantoate permease [Pseudohyphozyma bogoriensis]
MATPSLTTSLSIDPEKDAFKTAVAPVYLPGLEAVGEKDEDEARAIAGDVRHEFTQEESDAVKRKVDRRVIPILAAVYFSQFLDKNSLNYSSVMGLPIKGQHYNLVSLAFYIGYMVFEIPTSALAQHFPLAKYLGVNMLLWSASLWCHAASAEFAPFFVLRILLGVFECCVSPILIAMVSSWYIKEEQARRVACFYSMNGFTSILGGLMAYGVTFYKGTAVAHWRIMYFLLGGMALIVAISVLIWLPDSPATATFLTEREKLVAIERVRSNQTGTVNKKFKKHQALEAYKDPKTWLLILLTFLSSVPNGGLSSIKGFGFSSRLSLLMNVPEGVVAASSTIAICIWADKSKQRIIPCLAAIIPAVIGSAMLVGFSQGNHYEKYKGALMTGNLLIKPYGSCLALLYAWSAANCAGSTKKTVVNASFLVAFGLANVMGSEIFQSKDAPSYIPGKVSCLVLFAAMIPTIIAMKLYTDRQNKKKRAVLDAMIAENNWTPEDVQREADKHAFLDLTDLENPFFFYTS